MQDVEEPPQPARTGNESLAYHVPPRILEGFPTAQRTPPKTPREGGGLRARWECDEGHIYEWDYQHGRVEVYDARGRHLGEADPDTGNRTKGPDPSRRIEP